MIILRDKAYLQQREYGLKSDIVHSGIKRAGKKLIGRARKNIAGKLNKSIQKDLESIEQYNKNSKSIYRYNPNLESKLRDEAEKMGAPKIYRARFQNNSNESALIRNVGAEDVKKFAKYNKSPGQQKSLGNLAEDISKSNNKKVDGIFQPPESSSHNLAHEIGHYKNSKSKNPITNFISRKNLKNDGEIRKNSEKTINRAVNGNTDQEQINTGIKSHIKNYINGKLIVSEEKNATKEGLKLIKKHGSKEDVSVAKSALDEALEGYKAGSRVNWKMSIRDNIQLKSRRNKSIEEDLKSWPRKKK